MRAGGVAIEGGAAPRAPGLSLDQRVLAAYETELLKLRSQLAVRLLVLVCAIGPFAFSALLKVQSGTPADALFGAYVHASGFAVSLVVMGFAGSWGFPLIAGLVAGDQFASEDRHNTWKTILTRSCSLGELFTGKLLASATVAVAMLTLTMLSSLAAGLILVGGHGLVDLSGNLESAGRSLALTIVSWALCVLPLLAYVSLAALFSVASRNGIVGVVGPIVIALATTLIDLIGKGVWVHLLLIGSAFGGMYGLFTTHPFLGPLLVTSLVSLVWIAACTGAAWFILRRRDFLAGSAVRAPSRHAPPLRVVATPPRSSWRCWRCGHQPGPGRDHAASGQRGDRRGLQQRPACSSSDSSAASPPPGSSWTSSPSATAVAPSPRVRATGCATSTSTCLSSMPCPSSARTSSTT